ncbi:MAG TPA: septum formation initiator family protein [Niabella sp.]|nr:septum formation initiator family protein [Niabella sp.]HOZ95848.1 septum formation initiator family protein [Niabella sp.]HQW13702.1 septum formation initiator family protein [Niabella sp.]HQX19096.1 septum formation initiator family protein [Niabella sp.]HQX42741.1 septum formation initiator family protein [Niabella sp.]
MAEFVDFVIEKEPDIEQLPRKRKALGRLSSFLTNKFLLASLGFIAIMFFLDKNDIISTLERRKELSNLEQSKQHYQQELQELRTIKSDLETDPVIIEKLAREKYLMKRENEDIFLTEENKEKTDQ